MIRILVGGIGLLLAWVVLYPIFAQGEIGHHPRTSLSNVKQLVTAGAIYASDCDDRLMLAPTWMDGLGPYVKNESIYHAVIFPPEGRNYGFAMNRFLSGIDSAKFPEPASAHFIYESKLVQRNANEYMPTFPIPGRARDANAVGFLDGHAKMIVKRGKE